MQILNEEQISIRAVQTESDIDIPRSTIIVNGKFTDKVISGVVLETAISWDDFYLLFLTDDIPYEDALNIYFFDNNLNLLDSARLGSIYSTGSFALLDLVEPNKVTFRFIGDTDWEIELLPEPVFSIPFISDPKGVSRKFRFNKHFLVSGNPVPEQKKESAIM